MNNGFSCETQVIMTCKAGRPLAYTPISGESLLKGAGAAVLAASKAVGKDNARLATGCGSAYQAGILGLSDLESRRVGARCHAACDLQKMKVAVLAHAVCKVGRSLACSYVGSSSGMGAIHALRDACGL